MSGRTCTHCTLQDMDLDGLEDDPDFWNMLEEGPEVVLPTRDLTS